ncbi:MAG: ATP-binding cassette domain-containing protein [Nitriliruptorales bacterium]|nr:ATP-binding cassette domain-containing protein [Nitriliruptorales bacterium]
MGCRQASRERKTVILQLHDISKTYRTRTAQGNVQALTPLNLDIDEGELVSFVGPSGCGKSTLLNIVAGLLPPTTGEVVFDGAAMTEPSRRVGFMFQQPVLLPWRSVQKNVLLPSEVFGLDPEEMKRRAEDVLRLVGLGDFRGALPQHLSGGMQQRVALARVLVYQPKVLLMDEPFGALDEFTRETMNLELLKLTKPEGITVLFVTHNISEAVFLADRVVVMSPRPGRISGIIDVPFSQRKIDVMRDPAFTDLVFQVRSLLGDEADDDSASAEADSRELGKEGLAHGY